MAVKHLVSVGDTGVGDQLNDSGQVTQHLEFSVSLAKVR